MRIFHLMLKDLSQIIRDRKSLLFLVLMPIVFTLFMGVALGSNSSSGDARLAVAFLTADPEGVLSQQLQKLLDSSETIKLVLLPVEQAGQVAARVRSGEFNAAISVPSGFSAQTLAGQDDKLLLITDASTATRPGHTTGDTKCPGTPAQRGKNRPTERYGRGQDHAI